MHKNECMKAKTNPRQPPAFSVCFKDHQAAGCCPVGGWWRPFRRSLYFTRCARVALYLAERRKEDYHYIHRENTFDHRGGDVLRLRVRKLKYFHERRSQTSLPSIMVILCLKDRSLLYAYAYRIVVSCLFPNESSSTSLGSCICSRQPTDDALVHEG